MLLPAAMTPIDGGTVLAMDFALALSAASLLVTLIVCWIRSRRDKL